MFTPADLLMIPGPTPLPEAVRQAMARPAIGHRSPEFKAIMKRVLPGLQWAFQTRQEVLLYTASGTGAMEASLVNTLNPGDKVLGLTCGVFSARWSEVARSLGLTVLEETVPAGQPNLPETLKARLSQESDIKAVMLIHSETSTGVLNPVKQLVSVVRDYGALSIVDTVTSLASAPCPVDDWGIDVAVSGSQKGFMIPPGLSFLSYSDKAWQAHQQVKHPGFYFNFTKTRKAQADFTTPYTPATHLIMALDVALQQMQAEGLEAVHDRHRLNRDAVRAGVSALGLQTLVADDTYASWAATSVLPPEGLSVGDIRAGLKQQFGLVVADGQKDLKGKIFRIGHLGHIHPRDVLTTMAALEQVLQKLGHTAANSAVSAARHIYQAQPMACAL
jgi:aspartate aminotransferase-like enzyme